MIETEQLRIYPAMKEQMEVFIAAEADVELKKAYTEMLEGCLHETLLQDVQILSRTDGRTETHPRSNGHRLLQTRREMCQK